MNLNLTRKSYNQWGIVSELSNDAQDVLFITLEHAFQQDDGSFAPKVPPGKYLCLLGTHQLDRGGPFDAYEITGVVGHSGILFHIGNTNEDSNGCCLLGKSLGTEMILNSKEAFEEFMALTNGCASFTLTVTE